MSRVFVYGTLLRGEPNHRLIAGATFVGDARTRPEWQMISLGGFPAIRAGGETAIVGEVFEVDAATLAALDRLEGHPRLYCRTEVELEDGVRAETYVFQIRTPPGQKIVSGSWRQHQGRP